MTSTIRALTAMLLILAILTSPAAMSRENSLLLLPAHIEAPDVGVSLVADYGSARSDGRIPVYFINNTAKDVVLNAQDGDIYMKLEYQDADGNWVRAQPHAYSWCGNSYIDRTIRPGYFIEVLGYQPRNGALHTIRYSLYSQDIELASNVGVGVVASQDVERAANDAMSIREGTFEHVVEIATSDAATLNAMDHMRDLRRIAIWELA